MRQDKIYGFTLVELLVVILIISVLASFLVPAVFKAKDKLYRTQCMNRLRSIGQMAMLYADDNKQWFPVAATDEPRAHESLQLIVNTMKDARDPDMYICPASNDAPVEGWNEDSEEPFILDEDSVSYAWRNKKLRSSGGAGSKTCLGADNSIAISDEINENHQDGINMLYIDGAVKFLTISADLKDMKGFENQDLDEFLAHKQLGK
ncbi:MAG TPA: hypothetical protein DCM87_04200 [Planctomycetes bacterium]|nr:hypothetical protein [Planctomycetota bacterium]